MSNNMGIKIRMLREDLGLTLEQVGSAVGVGKSTVRKWETGQIANMKRDKIASLANVLQTTPAYLMGWNSDKETHSHQSSKNHGVQIPVYGNVAAGIPIEAITDIEDWEEIDEDMARNGEYMALRIKGDSMEPKISSGDVVIVRIQEDIENGEIAIVFVNGDDATCKRVKKTNEGIMLISTNPAYEPMFYSRKQCAELPIRILGKVVELRAKF